MSRLFFLFFFLPGFIFAAQTKDALTQLQEQLRGLQTFQADFTQVVKSSDDMSVMQEGQGKVILSRPGKFVWQVDVPTEQWLISDGKTLFIYDLDLEQVTLHHVEQQLAQTPMLLISGHDSAALANYQVTLDTVGEKKTYTLEAMGDDANFQTVRLVFSGDTLVAMQLTDRIGQLTELTFSHVKINAPVDDKVFAFTPPPGVDVIYP